VLKFPEFSADSFVTDDLFDIQYVTGMREAGNSLLLFHEGKIVFLTNKIYLDQAGKGLKNIEVDEISLSSVEKRLKGKTVSFDPAKLSLLAYLRIKKWAKKTVLEPDALAKVRAVKTEEEKERIKKAAGITKQVLKKLEAQVWTGKKEKGISDFIKKEYFSRGVKESFEPVTAGDSNSAYPHYRSGNNRLKSFFLVDTGCFYEDYAADLTRMVVLDNIKFQLSKELEITKEAKRMAEVMIRPGVRIKDVAEGISGFFKKKGMGDAIRHGLGHGLGLEIHEYPAINEKNDDLFIENMAITIEPGLYVLGKGGIRLEDTYIIKKHGVSVL